MKITQEVREFAAKQNQGAESFLAATPTVRPEPVEGLSFPSTANEKGRASTGSARTEVDETEAERGMAEMSEKFREKGGGLPSGGGMTPLELGIDC